MNIVKSDKELGKALKNNESTIIIEGDLKTQVIKIKAVGSVAWGIALGAIGVAVLTVLSAPATGGISAIAGASSLMPASAVLGTSTATSAIAIAAAAGSVGALNKLRSYKIVEKDKNRIVLKKS